MLIDDEGFEANIDPEFSPLITYKGYDMDYLNLSGGEKTAAALAYRLALNQVINNMMSSVRTRDIIILDEPTDGFSSEQLDKMRDLFKLLNVKQMIIVSHEQKVEMIADNIIRIKKENSISGLQ
jgi:exonuclease SbcC